MKYTSLLMAASISLLAGCSQMEQDFADVNSLSDGDLVEKVIFEVLPVRDGDNPDTKASAVPNGGTVGFIWEATDTVGIYPDKGSQVYFNIEDGVGTSSVSFTGGGWALKQNSTYASYYPFVGDIYLKRDKIPVSFAGQKQIGTTSPFVGARYYLATGASTSENGVLRFSYSTLNTIINVNATLPAGTYTKMSLTIEEPLFVEEGTYSLEDRVIVGTKFTNKLEIELEDVVLTEEATIPIYIMSAPVDLKGKKVTVRITTADGSSYKCIKTPTKDYMAGTRYGLTCNEMEREVQPNNVIYYTSSDGNIVTPNNPDAFGANIISNEYVDGLGIITFDGAVTSIGESAFNWRDKLTSIAIPDSVTSIGEFAFSECTGLTSITIPESVTCISPGAFCHCTSLMSFGGKYASPDGLFLIDSGSLIAIALGSLGAEVSIPEGVTSIGDWALSVCTDLTSITIPESVTSIGDYAFSGCTSLTSITIPDGVTSIGNNAFWNCTSLTSITIPDGVTSIGKNAFWNCTSLTSITIPANVTFFGYAAFSGCTSLTNITITDGVTSIGNSAFSGCKSLTSITIPDSVTSIGNDAFGGCKSLTSITIPDSVTSFGNSAFSGCTSLTSITIPESVTSIGIGVFRNCSSLKSFFGKYASPDGLFLIDSGSIIAVASGAINGAVTIPDGITSIDNDAFSDCTSLTSITIPDSVTSIGNSAFSNCTSLTSITIPDNVTSIGNFAFLSCTSLISITIPDRVTSIGDWAFQDCTSLTSITIPEMASIGNYAFRRCTSLTSITITDGVTSIGNSAFSGCKSLTSITIPDSVTSIGGQAFYDCTGLTSIFVFSIHPPLCGNAAFNANDSPIYVPAESVEVYKAAQNWNFYADRIQAIPE